MREAGISFGGDGEPWDLDPLPRLIDAADWEPIAAGLVQRAAALDAFAADAYGGRRIFAAGRVPERVLEASPLHEPRMAELASGRRWVDVCGFDLARRASGEMVVLEDNVRTPSGHAYAVAGRRICEQLVGGAGVRPEPIEPALGLLAGTLRAATPAGVESEPRIVVLTDGPGSAAAYEHRAIAEAISATLLTPAELRSADGRLWIRGERESGPIDVVYRRTDDSRLSEDDGELTPLGALLFEPMRAANLGVVNAFGAGIADDKLAHAYSEEMVRFYLDEEPLIAAIPTYDLAVPERRAEALERLDELVVKPRFGSGGERVLIVGEEAEGAERARARIEADPAGLIAQERVSLSTHPCVGARGLEPRRVDLRPFAYASADGYRVPSGGLTRYAPSPSSMIVNSSHGGGAKDTWVLA